MAVGIEAVMNAIKATVDATVPNVLPGTTFRELEGTGGLQDQQLATDEVSRGYRIYPRIDPRADWWNGSLSHQRQTIVLEIRYRVAPSRGGEARARLMAGSDASKLVQTVTRDFQVDEAPELTSINQLRGRQLRSLGHHTWLAQIEYEVTFFLGDEDTPPIISP